MQTTRDERRSVGTAFLVIALLAPLLALLPPDRDATPAATAAYLVLTVGVATLNVVGWRHVERWSGPTGIAYTIAVALLRHAEGGGSSGLAPLLLLPLFWASLVGTRRSLAMVVSAMAVVLVTPILAVGGELYPVTEWRRAAIWLVVAPVVGSATLLLRRRAEEARLAVDALARTDPLTSLLNRRGLEEVARRELGRVRRTGDPVSVALIDLDHFKRFNDERGHDAGDELLTAAAEVWGATIRTTDVLARWGGEEFVVLLPGSDPASAEPVLDRLRAATPLGQTCSIGVAPVVDVGSPSALADALARADEALYRAKEAGRDRITIAD